MSRELESEQLPGHPNVPSSTADSLESQWCRNDTMSQETHPAKNDTEMFMTFLQEQVQTREMVIVEEFLPGVLNQTPTSHGVKESWGLYTFWLHHPAEASSREPPQGEFPEDTASTRKVFSFVGGSDSFCWGMGCTPVYQEVLLPFLDFSDELRATLHKAGWVRETIDLTKAFPYDSFHEWKAVRTRQLQSKHSVSRKEYTRLEKDFHAMVYSVHNSPPSTEDEAKRNVAMNAHNRLSVLMGTEHTWLLKQYAEKVSAPLYIASNISPSKYYVLTSNGMLPLNSSRKNRQPKKYPTPEELSAIPLMKQHRMKWSVVRGKVVKRKRQMCEHVLAASPCLSPVEEARNSSAVSARNESALLVRPVSQKSLQPSLEPTDMPSESPAMMGVPEDDVLVYEVHS